MCQPRKGSLINHGLWFYAPLEVTASMKQDKTKQKIRKKRKNGGGQQRLDAICLLPSLQWLTGDGKRTLCSAFEDETLAERLMLVFL